LLEEFYTAFHDADMLLLTDIYAASEKPIKDISSETLLDGIKQHGQRHAYLESSFEDLLAKTMTIFSPGDVILTLGAGNIWQVGEKLLEKMDEENN
jgi:UDP-N-acetylmuramate--alanine ligase